MNRIFQLAMASKGLERCFNAFAGPYVTIFMLHRADPGDGSYQGTSEALLRRCLDYAVSRGYDFMFLDEVVERSLRGERVNRPTLCFTLDDGYSDQVARLVPILLEYQAKPTLFVITDFVDGIDWPWDAKIGYAVRACTKASCTLSLEDKTFSLVFRTAEERTATRRQLNAYGKTLNTKGLRAYLAAIESAFEITLPEKAPASYKAATWDELRALEQRGLRVGSHTRTHLILSANHPDDAVLELSESKDRLTDELANPSGVFCYPSGTTRDFAPSDERLVQKANYRGAVSTISETSYLKDIKRNPYRITRIGFPYGFDQFVRYASWIEALRSKLPV